MIRRWFEFWRAETNCYLDKSILIFFLNWNQCFRQSKWRLVCLPYWFLSSRPRNWDTQKIWFFWKFRWKVCLKVWFLRWVFLANILGVNGITIIWNYVSSTKQKCLASRKELVKVFVVLKAIKSSKSLHALFENKKRKSKIIHRWLSILVKILIWKIYSALDKKV